MRIEKAEITGEWGAPLLKVTDDTLRQRYYQLRPDGELVQGTPHLLLDQGYRVGLLICGDVPILLGVQRSLS